MRRITLFLARACLSALAAWIAPSFAAAQPDQRFVLTADGLGPVTRDAVIAIADVRAAYPEFSVDPEPFYVEGELNERIVAREGRAVVFTIELDDGRFRDITAFSPMITDENGASVGARFDSLPIRSRRTCVLLTDGGPYVACPSAQSLRLQYLFDSAPNLPRVSAPLTAIRVWQ